MRFTSLLFGLFLVGCASSPTQLPKTLSDSSDSATIDLLSRGQLFITQKVKKQDPSIGCEKLKDQLIVEIRSSKSGKISTTQMCSFAPGELTVASAALLPKGEYKVNVRRGKGRYLLSEKPVLSVRYSDPDFNSSPNQDFGGATELASNQSAKGTVHYTAGNYTDWIKVSGKNSNVTLMLLADAEENGVKVQVYRAGSASPDPILLGALTNKKRRAFRLNDDSLFVKVVGKKYEGEFDYTITRRDSAASKGIALKVLDTYPVSDGQSVVLLQGADSLKVNDQIAVFGKRSSGQALPLGRCRVQSIEAGQASCSLDKTLPTDVSEYRAEALES